MKEKSQSILNSYFSFEKESNEFNECLRNFIAILIKNEHSKIIPSKNILNYTHGQEWISTNSDNPEESKLKLHSSEIKINFDDVIAQKLEILPNLIKENVRIMAESAKRTIYQSINESCEKVGNSVHQRDFPDSAELYLATIEKLEFGVDEEGNVSLPEMHVGSIQFIEKLENDLMLKDEDFHQRLENVFREKIESALKREQIRLGKFVKND